MMPETFRTMLLRTFAEESAVLLVRLEEGVNAWRSGEREPEACLRQMRRDLHTLRGAADTVELVELSTVCYALSEFIERLLLHLEPPEGTSYVVMSNALHLMDALCAGEEPPNLSTVLDSLSAFQHQPRSSRPTHSRAETQSPETRLQKSDSATRVDESMAHVRRGFERLDASWQRLSSLLQERHCSHLDADEETSAELETLAACFEAIRHEMAQMADVSTGIAATPTHAAQSPQAAQEAAHTTDRRPRTILVVDDSISSRRRVRLLLEAAGHTVYEAKDGRDALAMIASIAAIDLVVTDLSMPHLDGTTLCRRIRKHADTAHMPIIVITALTDEQSLTSTLDAGADMFIPKRDFSEHRFMIAVNRLLPH